MPSSHLDGSLTDQTLKYQFCYEPELLDGSGTQIAWDWCQTNVATLRNSITQNLIPDTSNVYYIQYGPAFDDSFTIPSGLCTIDDSWPSGTPTDGIMSNGQHQYNYSGEGINGINFKKQDLVSYLGKTDTCVRTGDT